MVTFDSMARTQNRWCRFFSFWGWCWFGFEGDFGFFSFSLFGCFDFFCCRGCLFLAHDLWYALLVSCLYTGRKDWLQHKSECSEINSHKHEIWWRTNLKNHILNRFSFRVSLSKHWDIRRPKFYVNLFFFGHALSQSFLQPTGFHSSSNRISTSERIVMDLICFINVTSSHYWYSLILDNSSQHRTATIDFRNEAAQRYIHPRVVFTDV